MSLRRRGGAGPAAPDGLDAAGTRLLREGSPAQAHYLVTPPALPEPVVRRNWESPHSPFKESVTGHGAIAAYANLSYQLAFSTGDIVHVRGEGIVGRSPSEDKGYAHRVLIRDELRTLSRNHFEFGLTLGNEFWIADLGAANGTYVIQHGTQVLLTPHQRVTLGLRATIRFGECTAELSAVRADPTSEAVEERTAAGPPTRARAAPPESYSR